MNRSSETSWHAFGTWLIGEATVLAVIVANAVVLFLDAFPAIHDATDGLLGWIDYGCLLFFIVEALLKIRRFSFYTYWQSGWNKLDFVIVAASLPLLVSPFVGGHLEDFSILLLFRLGRLLRFSRVMRFLPNASDIWRGVLRALRASMAVFLVLVVMNLILAMGANLLFADLAPEYFGDPLAASYSLFKVFTIEGWYEIPDLLARRGAPGEWVFLLRSYFVFAVLVGGMLGLSLANAVFVDEMVADNTKPLERMVADLHDEVRRYREEVLRLQRGPAEGDGEASDEA